ncbi:MAG: hypothetical protein ACRDSJ_16955 [Rubrobacteraceae bacterium]
MSFFTLGVGQQVLGETDGACSPSLRSGGDQARQGLLEAGLSVFDSQVRRLAAFPKAALAGIPIYKIRDPRARLGWRDYERVGRR